MALHEVVVSPGELGQNTIGDDILAEARRLEMDDGLEGVTAEIVYRLEGITSDEAQILLDRLLSDPITEESSAHRLIHDPVIHASSPDMSDVRVSDDEVKVSGGARYDPPKELDDEGHRVEVRYKSGVMNPGAASIIKAANDLGIDLAAADSSIVYEFHGDVSDEQVMAITNRFLVNPTVQEVVEEPPETLLIEGEVGPINTIPLRNASDDELMAISQDALFLNLDEMKTIQAYFAEIGRDPTDVELETLGAAWSEHCVHKTFKSEFTVNGETKPSLMARLMETSRKYFGDDVISAFEDNSGVVRLYEGWAIAGKVETHNSPSAIEPYGGAMTGSGGVFRDILGTGQGAVVISSTDMFCFAPPDIDPKTIPEGCLRPGYLQRHVVRGVGDYGNRMGIPTNNGSFHFHPDFRAKPTIIVGSYGLLPAERAKKGQAIPGDLVIAIGGETGRDGIHGATFSSGDMTDRTINVHSTAVQIGNPIEEKRTLDALIEARDAGLIRAVTDCGAAGFSSAVGEMGENTGVEVDISRAPLKYEGLAPWEIWISESQERMVLAVDPDNRDAFLEICRRHNVEPTILGEFNNSGRLRVMHGDQVAVDLDYDFLGSTPTMEGHAIWEEPEPICETPEAPSNQSEWITRLTSVLSHGNVCSKEPIIRRYDHGVQGSNVLPPLTGESHDGPNDAVITTPVLGKQYGMVQSHGLNPVLNTLDPYKGSKWAFAEAASNYVAVGGNPDEVAYVNNYIWPTPTERTLGSLDRSVDAVVDCMKALERPVISGKDSLSSTYRGNGQVIEIPPVLCISAFGRIPDVAKTVTSDFKETGSTLCLVGKMDIGMGGSTYYDTLGMTDKGEVPDVDLEVLPEVLRTVHQAIDGGDVLSCHDVSEGGVITAVAEMSFGGNMGVELELDPDLVVQPDLMLFNETAGVFVIEVKDGEAAKELFGNVPYTVLGKTVPEEEIRVSSGDEELFTARVNDLKEAWKEPMRRFYS